jgi:hypothetical protein
MAGEHPSPVTPGHGPNAVGKKGVEVVAQKVRFPGHGDFWLINGRALAPLYQCNERGDIKDPEASSYAHIFNDGYIRRFGQIIGHRDDLVFLPPWA